MNGMPITMLNGLGCMQCGGSCSLGAVADYDQITIGGKTYTVNQIIDKTVVAGKDVTLYSNPSGKGSVVGTVKSGQPIGIVYSYIKPSNATSDGRSWLMFETTYNKFFYVPNEAVSGTGLKEQGTKTVVQEIKEEEAERLRKEDPAGYYLKKYALPALLIIGLIVIVGGIAKEGTKAYIEKKSSTKQ